MTIRTLPDTTPKTIVELRARIAAHKERLKQYAEVVREAVATTSQSDTEHVTG